MVSPYIISLSTFVSGGVAFVPSMSVGSIELGNEFSKDDISEVC
uniref:Uncharacterized protein n=1 Tax=Arundo donax TaxID=35708 RepID=A0A0A9C8L1_ARUDO